MTIWEAVIACIIIGVVGGFLVSIPSCGACGRWIGYRKLQQAKYCPYCGVEDPHISRGGY